jgi:GTP-binding protein
MQPQLHLEKTIYTMGQLKELGDLGVPMIALAGRSNVGKSSLINRLAGRKSLAKTSATPGKTRSVNYFRVDPGGWYLVDLPGYGYAKASKTDRAKWAALIEAYLTGKPGPLALAVLLDSRIEPQQSDLDLISYATHLGQQLIPVLTKADKIKQAERSKRRKQWKNILTGTTPAPLLFSAKSGEGSAELWRVLMQAAGLAIGEGTSGAEETRPRPGGPKQAQEK